MPGPLTDLLAWVVVLTFVASAVVARRSERYARTLAAVGWGLFALFWLLLVPHFAFVQRSYVEGLGTTLAVPACLYTGYLVWTRRPSLLILSRAVAVMGLIYLPFMTTPALQRVTIETVTRQAELLLEWLGYAPTVTTGEQGYRSLFVFTSSTGHRYTTPVLLACSGIGSISIVAGLVLSVRAPLRRKAESLAVVVPLIYVLNTVRVAFIVLAFGKQWFRGFAGVARVVFGVSNPRLASYFIADRVIAQGLSVVVLVAVTLWLLRRIPAVTTPLEEVAYVFTGREFDLAASVGREERAETGTGRAS